jgi:glycosyltransferase involved in cell wall biosynthesis
VTGKLAIFTSQLGTASETFIRRHVEDMAPGRTVVVARNSTTAFDGFWKAECPVLFLDRWELRFPVRVARRLGRSKLRMREDTVMRFLRKYRATVVLGEYLDQFAEFVPLVERMGLRYIVQGHGMDVSASLRSQGAIERYQCYRSAAAILTRCEFHRQRLIKIGLPSDRIHVNPGGVDVPDEIPAHPAGVHKRFLAIGRFVPKKGPIYLLEAFRLAAECDREITLDYLGGGELLPAAQQFVISCRLEGRVRLHGAGGNDVKSQLVRKCGVFVQHSLTDPETGDEEGLPAAIQEAMAQGMAVVSTRHAGIPEAIDHNVSGFLVDEKDVAAMAEAMLQVAHDSKLYERLGACAYEKAKQSYSWPAERSRLLHFLDSAVSSAVK